MDSKLLAALIGDARRKLYDRGEPTHDVCVTLNRTTFLKIQDELSTCQMFIAPGDTFEYYGALVSGSPAHAARPDAYSIGALWRGSK